MSFTRLTSSAALTFALLLASGAAAEAAEGGSGAYILGIRGPGAGITPPPGVFLSTQVYSYGGKIEGRVPVEGGTVNANGNLDALVAIPTLLWVTPFEFAGGRLGLSATVPYGRAALDGQVGPFSLSDSVTTFADPSFSAFLGWRAGNVHWQLGVTGFAPIGDYTRGALANIAKHRGALDVFGSLTLVSPQWGLDFTNTLGVTFNTANKATDYKTGNEFHWDWSLTKKFAGGISIGPTGYFYKQLTDDSGSGAVLGGFRGEVWAVGATVGYEFNVGRLPVTTRLRYFHEIETRNRFQGDSVFVGVSMPLWVQQ